MSVGFTHRNAHPHHGSGILSPEELTEAEDLLAGEVKVDNAHEVPFCAGMSKDGRTMYVDRSVDLKRGGMDRTKPLLVHEVIEYLLIQRFKMKYPEAHNLALAAEEACVNATGMDRAKYNRLWDEDIRRVGSRGKYKDIPADLQTDQYEDSGTKEEKSEMGLLGGGKSARSDPYDYGPNSGGAHDPGDTSRRAYGGKAMYRAKDYGV